MNENTYTFTHIESGLLRPREGKHLGGMRLNWVANIGFGQCDFLIQPDGSTVCHSECMGEEFVAALLAAFSKYVTIVP